MARDDKTEKPTAKRRGEARKKGQVAKSQDLSGAVALAAGVLVVCLSGAQIVGSAGGAMRAIFAQISRPGAATTAAGLNGLEQIVMRTMLSAVAPVAGICLLAGVLANVAQVGVRPAWSRIKPDIKRLNPVTGFKTKFGSQVLFETGKSLAKVVAVGATVALALVPQITHLAASVGTPPAALGRLLGSAVKGIAERAVIVYLMIAIIDFVWQKRRTAKSQKMTKQEVKDEGRQTQLPAEVRGAIRRRQMQAARARMMAAVPQADVVVTNPTHYAV
ncbi:MAG: EscU/YscU/HrcU family type III secretion system export apparatus switch protein, partial [Solirubrobacteraceae bacterium]